MEEQSIGNHESDAQMALRLMNALDYRENLSYEKKRYMLENWPENAKKCKKLDFFTVKYVPEVDLRYDKDISAIRSIVEGSITALRRSLCDQECDFVTVYSSHDLSPSKIPDVSDLGLVKMSSSLLSRLNDRSLRALFTALKGNHIACDERHMIEYQVRLELEKSVASLNMHSQQMLTITSILRNPSSYFSPYCLTNLHIKPFPSMPESIWEAASEAFKYIDQFPTSIIVEACKLLISDFTYASKTFVGIKNRKRILNLVHKEVEILLCSFKEGHSLPMNVENALHLLSFSARILYGDDGNLRELLKPLSSKQCSLETVYKTAFSQLRNVQSVDLLRIFNTIGQPFKRKKECICELQKMLISSIHCIYNGVDIPVNISKSLSMINAVSDAGQIETDFTNDEAMGPGLPYKGDQRIKFMQRIKEEVDSVLDVSAEFRNLIWESYAAFSEHVTTPKISSTDVKHTIHDGEPRYQGLNKDGDSVNVKSEKIEFMAECQPQLSALSCLKCERLCEEPLSFIHDVERFSDEVASATYILIGCLFQEVSHQRCIPLQTEEASYLLTGLPGSSVQSNYHTSEAKLTKGQMLDKLILETAKRLLIIPMSVQQKVEERLDTVVEAVKRNLQTLIYI